jgi:hypothetical protein
MFNSGPREIVFCAEAKEWMNKTNMKNEALFFIAFEKEAMELFFLKNDIALKEATNEPK